ncbi:MAG: Fic family protein [Flavobacteriales bacterium]
MWKIDLSDINDLQIGLDRIEQKKLLLDTKRPMAQIALDRLREGLNLEWTYNSTSIEGNTLTLNETRVVLQDGMTVKGKSMREHFEVANHHDAIEYLEGLVGSDAPMQTREILDLHELVMLKLEKFYAGRFRNAGVRIAGANFTPPNARKVSDMVDELIDYVNQNEEEFSPIVLATVFHHRFVWIHPFFDGNGRTVRLAMNLLLMRKGYPPAIILKNDRRKYYAALNQANNGSYAKLLLLMMQAVERSLDIYLSMYPDANEYKPISNIVEESQLPYGQEYVSLLARQGKIDAYKEGRNWVTTQEAIVEYMANRQRKR